MRYNDVRLHNKTTFQTSKQSKCASTHAIKLPVSYFENRPKLEIKFQDDLKKGVSGKIIRSFFKKVL